MGKTSRVRKTKPCALCASPADVLFRINISADSHWLLVCKNCQKKHKDVPTYQYGGTWKSKKRN